MERACVHRPRRLRVVPAQRQARAVHGRRGPPHRPARARAGADAAGDRAPQEPRPAAHHGRQHRRGTRAAHARGRDADPDVPHAREAHHAAARPATDLPHRRVLDRARGRASPLLGGDHVPRSAQQPCARVDPGAPVRRHRAARQSAPHPPHAPGRHARRGLELLHRGDAAAGGPARRAAPHPRALLHRATEARCAHPGRAQHADRDLHAAGGDRLPRRRSSADGGRPRALRSRDLPAPAGGTG